MERLNQMIKTIEEQATIYQEYYSLTPNCGYHFTQGAKARDAQWLKVVNELRSAVRCDYGCKTNQDHGWMVVKCNCGSEKSLTKADQLMKEMGIKL